MKDDKSLNEVKDFYETDATEYDQKRFAGPQHWQDSVHQQMLRDFLAELPSDAHILEIGCGTGRFTETMITNGFQVTAVDVAKSMLQQTKTRVTNHSLTTILGDVTNLGFAPQTFDAVVMINVISHIPNPQEAFLELSHVLRRGGRLFINFPHLYSLYFPIAKIVNYMNKSIQDDVYSHWYSKTEMRSLIHSANFLIDQSLGHCIPPRNNSVVSEIVRLIDAVSRNSVLKSVAGNLFIHATRM